jgi:hypothetical protein
MLRGRSRPGRRATSPAIDFDAENRAAVADIADAIAAEDRARAERLPFVERQRIEALKWQLIRDVVRRAPFESDASQPRSTQWRAVVEYARAVREPAVLDWVLQQVDIAEHHETGIRDLRPRGSGPCHQLLLRHVGGRARRARKALDWARAAETDGGNGDDDAASDD